MDGNKTPKVCSILRRKRPITFSREAAACDTVIAGGALMPVAARAKAPDIETFSIE
jgi:hypothetical protein